MSALTRAMTEDELLTAITEAATYRGWRWVHYRRSDLAQMQGHSGFPDVVLAKDGRVIFLELKSRTGKLRPDQHAWAEAIGEQWIGAWPDNLDEVLDMLKADPAHDDALLHAMGNMATGHEHWGE